MYLQKVISKKPKKNLVDALKVTDENGRIRIRTKISWIRKTGVSSVQLFMCCLLIPFGRRLKN
jgi:hypothetical protein